MNIRYNGLDFRFHKQTMFTTGPLGQLNEEDIARVQRAFAERQDAQMMDALFRAADPPGTIDGMVVAVDGVRRLK